MNPVNPPPCPLLLAQDYDVTGHIFWSLIVIALLVVGFLAVVRVRRWLTEDKEQDDEPGFTLGDLRRLRKAGKMTDEEFEKARAQMIVATQRAADRAAEEAARARKDRGGAGGVEELRARARRNRDAEMERKTPESDIGPEPEADDN